jgi:MerR family mercuric resistance operon transcriptional regulator
MAKRNDPVPTLTIGRLARECGATVDTIRYYEREGLLAPPRRSRSGYRLYATDALERLRFIRRAKALGFALDEIRELLALRVDRTKSCGDVRARARAKIADIENRIGNLEQMRSALERLAAACSGAGPTNECPILDALQAGEESQAASSGKTRK